jgi:hypothetical protein
MGPTIHIAVMTHHTPIFSLWSGISKFCLKLILLQYLLFWEFICPLRWNQISSVKNVSCGSRALSYTACKNQLQNVFSHNCLLQLLEPVSLGVEWREKIKKYGNINQLLTRTRHPLVSPEKFFLPLYTQPPPCNLPERSLLVRIQLLYPLTLICSLPSAFALQVLYKPSTPLPCHFSPWRWRQNVSLKHWHWAANSHCAKTQDFYNMIITAVRTSNLSYRSASFCTSTVLVDSFYSENVFCTVWVIYSTQTKVSLNMLPGWSHSKLSVHRHVCITWISCICVMCVDKGSVKSWQKEKRTGT